MKNIFVFLALSFQRFDSLLFLNYSALLLKIVFFFSANIQKTVLFLTQQRKRRNKSVKDYL